MAIVIEKQPTALYIEPQSSVNTELLPEVLTKLAQATSEEEFTRVDKLSQQLLLFNYWLENIAGANPICSSSLKLKFSPRQLEAGKDQIIFSPALPFLEGSLSFASLAFDRYQSARLADPPNLKKAEISLQTAEGMCQVLQLLQQMGKGKIKWRRPAWQQTTDGFKIFKGSINSRNDIKEVYYTPGRNRFAVRYLTGNPRAPNPPSSIFAIEIRLDPEAEKGCLEDGKLEIDFSVKQISLKQSSRSKQARYHYSGAVELTDFVFGPRVHHLLLGQGNYLGCVSLVHQTMAFLNVPYLIKDTTQIPPNHFERKLR